jgi:hypothetical protein
MFTGRAASGPMKPAERGGLEPIARIAPVRIDTDVSWTALMSRGARFIAIRGEESFGCIS